jgi:RNA polymerase sigma factor (sigma-70 family)
MPIDHRERGHALEREVERLYSLLGAATSRRVLVKTYEIDVLATIQRGPVQITFAIECKEYGPRKLVSDGDMKSFVAKVLAGRECGRIDKGVFVTTSGYMKTAIATATLYGIQCLTLGELENGLVKFDSYLARVLADYEASQLCQWFVEPRGSELEDYETLNHATLEHVHADLVSYVDRVLFQLNRPRLAILGNFGTGKSSFCIHYQSILARRVLNDPSARIPIFINLRDFRSQLDVHQAILGTLHRLPGVHIELAVYHELLRRGRFILLFDGLDEMAARVDRGVINENLRELDRLRSDGDCKYVVTCRTHFFQERVSEEFLLDYDVIYVIEWAEDQLKTYLMKRVPQRWRELYERIVRIPALRDLAKTPLLADMLVNGDLPASGDLNLYSLFTAYTQEWLVTQAKRRGAVMTARKRTDFVLALASALFSENSESIHFSRLYALSQRVSGYTDAASIDHFDSDARTCTFITRDSAGRYGFLHRSFFEFFVAECVVQELTQGDAGLLRSQPLTPEIIEFLAGREWADEYVQAVRALSSSGTGDVLARNANAILSALGRRTTGPVAESTELSREWREFQRLLLDESEEGIELLFRKYGALLKRWGQGRVPAYAGVDIDDLVSETLARAWQAMRENRFPLTSEWQLQAYLRQSLLNRIRDVLRVSARRPLDGLSKETKRLTDPSPAPLEVLIANESRQVLLDAMKELREPYRTIIQQIDLDGHSIEAVASSLGLSLASTQHLRSRARRLLKDLIAKRLRSSQH